MENKKVSEKKDSWLKVLLSYTEGSGQRLGISVILSVISIISGLMPYYCIYRGIDLYIRNLNQAPMQEILRWCLYALLFYTIKIVSFSASTWISHIAAYHILEGLRLRLTDRFLKAPLGDVEGHSIGEIKSIMVEKIENMEPPIAHMIPEGSGHILLPVISFIALLTLDWRIALASLVTVPLSLVFMTLTMIISGKSFTQYDESNAHMNSTIVEYIEGIEREFTPSEFRTLSDSEQEQLGLRSIVPEQIQILEIFGDLENAELKVCNLSFKRKKQMVFQNISLSARAGDIIGITGKNGAGKGPDQTVRDGHAGSQSSVVFR